MENDIDEILLDIQNGNSNSLDVLYDKYANTFFRLCYSYLKNTDDANDALSDTFYLVAKNIMKYKGKKGFNWIYTIAKNNCLNKLKEKERYVNIDPTDEEVVNKYNLANEEEKKSSTNRVLDVAREVLKPEEVNIIVLHVIYDYKFKEIANMLGKLETTIRSRYNYSINKLRPILIERGITNESD